MKPAVPRKPRKTFANVHMLGQRMGFRIPILSEAGCFQLADAKSILDFCRRHRGIAVFREARDRFIELGYVREYGDI